MECLAIFVTEINQFIGRLRYYGLIHILLLGIKIKQCCDK